MKCSSAPNGEGTVMYRKRRLPLRNLFLNCIEEVLDTYSCKKGIFITHAGKMSRAFETSTMLNAYKTGGENVNKCSKSEVLLALKRTCRCDIGHAINHLHNEVKKELQRLILLSNERDAHSMQTVLKAMRSSSFLIPFEILDMYRALKKSSNFRFL